eukprot:11160336-Lingulodinium_polyedra.AAC.1
MRSAPAALFEQALAAERRIVLEVFLGVAKRLLNVLHNIIAPAQSTWPLHEFEDSLYSARDLNDHVVHASQRTGRDLFL